MTTTFEPFIAEKWLTPHFVAIRWLFTKNDVCVTHLVTILLTSALFQLKIEKLRHTTSRDVTTSDFDQTFPKCFFPSYLTCVQI